MPLQGKGKESLAQRSLPLRPPPETWGTPPSPIPPLGTKGRNCGLNTVAPTGSQPLCVCQPGCFLESGSLTPPPAALRRFPLWKPPPKDRKRQRKKKQMVSSLQPDKRHTRRCEDAVIQGTSVSTAGRRLLDFVGSAYRPLLRMGELTACGQLIPNIFSFPPYTAHFLFDVSKRKWGVYSDRQSLHPCGGSLHPDRNVPLLEAKKILGTFLTAKP